MMVGTCISCRREFRASSRFANHFRVCKGPRRSRREAALRRWSRPEEQEKQSKRISDAWANPETRINLEISINPESIARLHAGRDASWKDERRVSRLVSIREASHEFHSNPERPEYVSWIEKQSENAKRQWELMSVEDKIAYSKLMSGLTLQRYVDRPELRSQIASVVSVKQRARSEEISKQTIDSWANPVSRAKRLESMARMFRDWRAGSSLLENKVALALENLGVEINPELNRQQVVLGWYIADFFWSDKQVVLEVNGCRWHCCESESCKRLWGDFSPSRVAKIRGNASRKHTRMTNEGLTVLYLWEHDFPGNMGILNQVAELLKN
jgi:G:T-mismatch repair DNA endonuclease (very short patch repair protein)